MAEKHHIGMDIQRKNRAETYRLLWKNEGLTKQQIADTLGLCLPTTSHNLEHFESLGLIRRAGFLDSTGGRRARTYAIDPRARCAVGVEITANHITVVLVDLYGAVQQRIRERKTFERSKSYFSFLGAMVERVVQDFGVNKEHVLGVGIGVPGLITQDHSSIFCGKVLNFEGATCDEFSAFIPYPTALFNDANAAGFAERWSFPDMPDSLYISLSRSVGGALLLGGQLYTGQNLRGGEVGHMTVVPEGRTCYCGRKGCLDAYCAVNALCGDAELADFFHQAEMGDDQCTKALEGYLHNLSIAVNNVRMLMDCHVILGGSIGPWLEPWLPRLRELVAARDTFESECTYLSVCRYKNEPIAAGSALFFIDQFIENI